MQYLIVVVAAAAAQICQTGPEREKEVGAHYIEQKQIVLMAIDKMKREKENESQILDRYRERERTREIDTTKKRQYCQERNDLLQRVFNKLNDNRII